jgi:glycosyltransferase involved in cell wall biosynthesis
MSSRMLVLDQYDQLGGAQRCLLNLLPAFTAAGLTTHLAIPGDGPLAAGARAHGAAVHAIPCGPYHSVQKGWTDAARFAYDLPRQALEIQSLVRRHNIGLIYVNGPRLLAGAALAAFGRPLVFHAHSIVEQVSAARLMRRALRSAGAHVIAACRFVLDRLAPVLPAGRSHVIYNGIAPMQCARRKRKYGDPWRIGVIGRIAPEKGQLEFVRAARLLLPHERCEFVVCGASMFSSDEYSRRVCHESEGLPIEFLGWRSSVSEVLSTLDLVVVPSAMADAAPLVILEAFSAGVPVVASRSGGIPELVDHRVTGVLCSPDPTELANTLLEVMRSGAEGLDSLAVQATRTLAERFSLERYRAEVLRVVRHAL